MQSKCPNCGSRNFKETISREFCPDCGIECDYHGGGANAAYNEMCSRQSEASEEKFQKLLDDLYGEQ